MRTVEADFSDPSRPTPSRGAFAGHPGRVLHTTFYMPVSGGPFPLVVFAPGFAVTASTYDALLSGVAGRGFLVAAVEIPGETAFGPGTPVEADIDQAPCDLGFVAAKVVSDPPPGVRASPGPVGVAGHSDGATAAVWAGFASTCSGVRFGAVVALSARDVPRVVSPPPALLAVSGTADEVNPFDRTKAVFDNSTGVRWMLAVSGGRHLGTFTTDPDLDRVAAVTAAFLATALAGDASGLSRARADASGRLALTVI